MKMLAKFLKVLLIIVLSFIALIYGGVFLGHKVIFPEPYSKLPTIQPAADGTLTLGVQPNAPSTIEGYTELLAGQIKKYNEIASSVWPGSETGGQSAVIEEIESKRFWFISPDGAASEISEDTALSYGFTRNAYFGGFDTYNGGMYLAVAEGDLQNYLLFQKYLHVGTYDAFITFTHELFHMKEQTKWADSGSLENEAREEFLDDTPARAKRVMLQKQLLKAINANADKQLILEALSTYEDYKTQFPVDYKNSIPTDRSEGTAYYFELITSLYSAYPQQIKTEDDLYRALALLSTREDIYVDYGLVAEGYNIGGFACILMDMQGLNWKESLVNNAEATPIQMLADYFEGEQLPPAAEITQKEIDETAAKIQQAGEDAGPYLLFRSLYEMLF